MPELGKENAYRIVYSGWVLTFSMPRYSELERSLFAALTFVWLGMQVVFHIYGLSGRKFWQCCTRRSKVLGCCPRCAKHATEADDGVSQPVLNSEIFSPWLSQRSRLVHSAGPYHDLERQFSLGKDSLAGRLLRFGNNRRGSYP